MVVIVLGAPSGKRGDWGWDYMFSFFATNNGRTTVIECCVLKALFSLVWHSEITSVFGMGQSMNSMAWKLVNWAKFVLVLTNTHLLKNQESSGAEFQRYTMAHNCHGKRLNLTPKRITTISQQKNVLWVSQKFCCEVFFLLYLSLFLFAARWGCSFCCESFSFCCEVFLLAARLIRLPWQFWATVLRWGKQQAIG